MKNELSNLSFPEEYFCDEVRDGFYVSETMKHYWASELKVLSVIDSICQKHNIDWFADGGTLIGAVRHNGYIPWDDDIDITMLREDFENFLAHARKELPENYCILYVDDNEEYRYPFCRITNSHAINRNGLFLQENFNCPFVSGVDIFPLDNVFSNPTKEADRVKRGSYVFSTIKGILEKKYSESEISFRIKQIENDNNIVLGSIDILRSLVNLFNDISKECKDDNSPEIALMYIWTSEGKYRYPRNYYAKWTAEQFETTTVRVPENYHEILTSYYGNYMKAVKGTSAHDYPVYRELEKIYRETFQENPSRYFFQKERFTPSNSKQTLLQKYQELISLICQLHKIINEEADNQRWEKKSNYLQNCQETAITIGKSLEGKFGNGTKAVMILEQYCEKVYEASIKWNSEVRTELERLISDAEMEIDRLFEYSRKEVLFLPCKFSWWENMKALFQKLDADKHNNVHVIPIPYYFHDNFEVKGDLIRDTGKFEQLCELQGKITNFDEYDLKNRHPDVIVIQYPFDECNGAMGIPELLYSSHLGQYTDKLIYVPYLNPDPPESDDDIAYSAMLDLVEQPAVFNSDLIIVGSKELRDYYIKMLVNLTDDSMQNYWENKVVYNSQL